MLPQVRRQWVAYALFRLECAIRSASILGVGYLIPLVYLIWSMRYGKEAPANPWGAKGLEWETASPPPTENFPETPRVEEEAYAYDPTKEATVG